MNMFISKTIRSRFSIKMKIAVLLFIVVMSSSNVFSHENYASILAEQLNQYCETRACPESIGQGTHLRAGKAGPRGLPGPVGPRGLPGPAGRRGETGRSEAVNYTLIEEMIVKTITELTSVKIVEQKQKMIAKQMKDCANAEEGFAKSWYGRGGVFDIYPTSSERSVEVYCEVTTDGGRWIVFQRRIDGSVDFHRNWNDYVNGFGSADRNFWLGLENLHQLTSHGNYELRVDMENWEGNTAYALYTTFSIGDATSKYRLNVGGYSGTAGDSLAYHNGQSFYTKDADRNNCAGRYIGAWWYKNCHYSNLNGLYMVGGKYSGSGERGIEWYHWRNAYWYSLKWVEMKFRPRF